MKSLPNDFLVQINKVLGEDSSLFLESLNQHPRASIRLNSKKLKPKLELSDPVQWASNAYYLHQKPSFTLDPFFHAGHYYVQEASSMILEKVLLKLDLEKIHRAIDLCAAPGGKTTQLIDLLPSQTLIHAHEVQSQRAEVLRQNVEKWGRSNIIVSSGSIQKIVASGSTYQLILIDAPCSGEGMFRKEPEALSQWTMNKVNHCTKLQSEILQYAKEILEPGGYLIYSTCTYNPMENEEIVRKLIADDDFESIEMNHLKQYGVQSSTYPNIHTYRCLPHKMEGEGFTFSLLRKSGSTTIPKISQYSKSIKFQTIKGLHEAVENTFINQKIKDYNYAIPPEMRIMIELLLATNLNILSAGIPIGSTKGKDWFPAHGLSQSIDISSNFSKIVLDLPQALHYLRADNNHLPQAKYSDPWQLISYEEAILGWVKNIQGKLKNYLPKNQRIHSL